MERIELLVKEISTILLDKGLTIGTAESCTSGLIAASLASIDGASKYFRGGIISYATDLKTSLLDVDEDCIEENDVVSAQVAQSMALGGLKKLNVDVCVGITGYVGLTGGSEKSPRGTVWICSCRKLASGKYTFLYRMIIVNGSRGENIQKAIENALEIVFDHIKEE